MLYVIQVFSKQNGETPPQSLGTLQVDYDDSIFTTVEYNTWLDTLGEQHFSPENIRLLYVMHYTRKYCPEVKDRILKMDPAPGTQSNAMNNSQTTGTGVPITCAVCKPNAVVIEPIPREKWLPFYAIEGAPTGNVQSFTDDPNGQYVANVGIDKLFGATLVKPLINPRCIATFVVPEPVAGISIFFQMSVENFQEVIPGNPQIFIDGGLGRPWKAAIDANDTQTFDTSDFEDITGTRPLTTGDVVTLELSVNRLVISCAAIGYNRIVTRAIVVPTVTKNIQAILYITGLETAPVSPYTLVTELITLEEKGPETVVAGPFYPYAGTAEDPREPPYQVFRNALHTLPYQEQYPFYEYEFLLPDVSLLPANFLLYGLEAFYMGNNGGFDRYYPIGFELRYSNNENDTNYRSWTVHQLAQYHTFAESLRTSAVDGVSLKSRAGVPLTAGAVINVKQWRDRVLITADDFYWEFSFNDSRDVFTHSEIQHRWLDYTDATLPPLALPPVKYRQIQRTPQVGPWYPTANTNFLGYGDSYQAFADITTENFNGPTSFKQYGGGSTVVTTTPNPTLGLVLKIENLQAAGVVEYNFGLHNVESGKFVIFTIRRTGTAITFSFTDQNGVATPFTPMVAQNGNIQGFTEIFIELNMSGAKFVELHSRTLFGEVTSATPYVGQGTSFFHDVSMIDYEAPSQGAPEVLFVKYAFLGRSL